MGFIKNIKLDNEIVVEGVYGKITILETTPNSCKFKVDYYPTRENSKREQTVIHTRYYVFKPILDSEENIFTQAYNNLRIQSDFEDMKDTIED